MSSRGLPATQRAAFEAESWALVRWLIDNSRLAQAGAYLNAVQSRGAPRAGAGRASPWAPPISTARCANRWRSLREEYACAARREPSCFKSRKVSAADAHVLKANLSLFGPGGGSHAERTGGFYAKNQENAAVHRSLAWAFLLRS